MIYWENEKGEIVPINKKFLLCKFRGMGCAKEHACMATEEAAEQCCAYYKYFDFLIKETWKK